MKWEIDAFVNCFFLFSPTLNCVVVVVVFYFATFCFSFSLCSFLCLFNLHLIAALPPRGGAPCMKRATCAFHLHAHIFISSQRGRGTGAGVLRLRAIYVGSSGAGNTLRLNWTNDWKWSSYYWRCTSNWIECVIEYFYNGKCTSYGI